MFDNEFDKQMYEGLLRAYTIEDIAGMYVICNARNQEYADEIRKVKAQLQANRDEEYRKK